MRRGRLRRPGDADTNALDFAADRDRDGSEPNPVTHPPGDPRSDRGAQPEPDPDNAAPGDPNPDRGDHDKAALSGRRAPDRD
ncbi:MAG: hypothetical protein ACRDGH_03520 [Candidatus Limnocylindria bacterium]